MTYERFVKVIENGEDLILKIYEVHDKNVWVPLYEFPMTYISSVAVETLRAKLTSERAKTIRLRDENDKFKAMKSARLSEQALKDATSKVLELCAKIDEQGRSIQALEAKLDSARDHQSYPSSPYSSKYRRCNREFRDVVKLERPTSTFISS